MPEHVDVDVDVDVDETHLSMRNINQGKIDKMTGRVSRQEHF